MFEPRVGRRSQRDKKKLGNWPKKGRAPQRLLFLTPVKSVYFSIAITSWLMAMLFICGAGVDDGCFFGLLLLMLLRIFFCLMAVIRTIMIGFLALLIRVESGLKKNFLFETKWNLFPRKIWTSMKNNVLWVVTSRYRYLSRKGIYKKINFIYFAFYLLQANIKYNSEEYDNMIKKALESDGLVAARQRIDAAAKVSYLWQWHSLRCEQCIGSVFDSLLDPYPLPIRNTGTNQDSEYLKKRRRKNLISI